MRYFPLAVAAVVAAAPAQASLPEVQAHLRAVDTMTADFVQTAANGASVSGKMTLARPGKVRFQYANSPLLVVADGKALNVIDYRVAQVSRWPIRNTPLAVLLDTSLDLSRYAREVASPTPGTVTVEARDPKHREYGTITMLFARDAAAPGRLRLTGWRVLDAQNNITQVRLSNVRFNLPVAKTAFAFTDPRRAARSGPRG